VPVALTTASADAGLAYLEARLRVLDARVRDAVERRRAGDPNPDDHFRGLYVSDAEVDRLLDPGRDPTLPPAPPPVVEAAAEVEAWADGVEGAGGRIRLRELARTFGLDACDSEILLVALAPDLDPRFERLYGYLHDDVSRRRASVGLALELCTGTVLAGPARRRLEEHGPLVAGALLVVEDQDRPFLTRSLRVPDRVTAHLLGGDEPDPAIAGLLGEAVVAELPGVETLARGLGAGVRLAYVREGAAAAGTSLAVSALAATGTVAVVLDLRRLGPADERARVARIAAREARLAGGALVAGPVDVFDEHDRAAVRAFAELDCTVVLVGSRTWDPSWSRQVPLVVEAPVLGHRERAAVWGAALGAAVAPGVDPAEATVSFRLAPEQIVRAAAAARQRAAAEGRPVGVGDIHHGARAQNAAGLERLAHRVEPAAGWDDLVLPGDVAAQLHELCGRVRHRERVLDGWGMASPTKGRGVTALFAGESGTGKTMSAEVIARELGLDLYVIDLSTVVDKYIGETEKNLDRIFAEADRVNGVLLFDEADALFGKRSEVQDARDRYANVEVAYLLQRMERFDGLAVLTSNLRANLDEAFTRRLDAIIDFPVPEEEDRLRLWDKHLRPGVPRAPDVDLAFLAKAFRLSGGSIRNIALGAALLASEAGGPVGMRELVRATEREYRKLGRLCLPDEFGPYYELLGRRSR
jgi:hypothetical protein